jgi:hypothetical protein
MLKDPSLRVAHQVPRRAPGGRRNRSLKSAMTNEEIEALEQLEGKKEGVR